MRMNPQFAVLLSGAALDSFEPFTTTMFERVLKRGDVVVDIGANVGYYSLLAAKVVEESGRVYAFEPSPRSFSVLVENIALNGYSNVIPVAKAITDKVGTAKLFVYGNPEYDNLSQPNSRRKSVQVETETLDNFFAYKGATIDVIKMDIEGGEMNALAGMENLIRQNRNVKMFVEFSPYFLQRSGHQPTEFLQKLAGYGFSIYVIDESRRRLRYISDINGLSEAHVLSEKNLFLVRR